jgi:hypothetical protein
MPDRDRKVPPAARKEWYKGTVLSILAIGILLLIALFILVDDELFSHSSPEETNLTVRTGQGGG